MKYTENKSVALESTTLVFKGVRTYTFQVMLVGLAVVLPYVLHSVGAPVRYLVPMHWVVILAGLVYGWRSGAITGFLSPVVSFMISGMPSAVMLAPMVLELSAYGIIAGLLRENLKMNSFAAVAIALISGRVIFLFAGISVGTIPGLNLTYLGSAMLPGLIAAGAQIILLPFAAKLWVGKENKSEERTK